MYPDREIVPGHVDILLACTSVLHIEILSLIQDIRL